jgi:hypothetical protein
MWIAFQLHKHVVRITEGIDADPTGDTNEITPV